MNQKGIVSVSIVAIGIIFLVLICGFVYFSKLRPQKLTIVNQNSPFPNSVAYSPTTKLSTQPVNVVTSLATASATQRIPQDWKLYANPGQEYQIEYPPDWINNGEQPFQIPRTYADLRTLSSICFGRKNGQAICELRISVLNGGWDKAKQYFDTIFESGTRQTITFNGVNGIKEVGSENYAELGALVILLEKDNKEYLIQEFTGADSQVDWQTLDQILASFKFLD